MSKLWQDLDKIMAFVTVAEKGKINKAAETLHLTQPSITRSIQKLEDSFGTPLFVRSREGVKLTPAGELLYAKASKFLLSVEDVRLQAQNIDEEVAGHLVVGTYESLAEYLWPDFLMSLAQTYPALHLSLKTGNTHVADLIAGRIQLLVDAEPDVRASMTSWPLYSDKFCFYGTGPFTKLTTDTNVIYVSSARDEKGLTIQDHLARGGLEFAREYCFDSFSTAKRMAIRGLGVAVLPLRLAEEDERKKIIRRISVSGFGSDGFGRHTICATVSAENEKDVRLKRLIALLKKHLK
jgi:DNA-binding transcriptional LysR family regulator